MGFPKEEHEMSNESLAVILLSMMLIGVAIISTTITDDEYERLKENIGIKLKRIGRATPILAVIAVAIYIIIWF